MRGLRSVLFVVLAGIVAVVLFSMADAPQAQAHAILERSLPAQNEQLASPPELIETWYSELLERSLTELQVLDTLGEPVQTGET